MKPELKAFKFYKKNINYYLQEMESFWGDNDKQLEMYNKIAEKFGTTGERLMEICLISYNKSVERAFR
jgi:hypothetical protein